jgi:hypothetical protein
MHIAIATIVGGCASVNASGGASSGALRCRSFCGLIWVDGEHHHQLGALSDPSPKGLGNVFDIGDEQLISVDGSDIDADLVMEVQCASLVRPLCRTLLASCKAAGVLAPTYTWEQWQSKLHKLLFPAALWGTGGPLMALDKVLPCNNRVYDGCVAYLVLIAAAIVFDKTKCTSCLPRCVERVY